MDINPLLSCLNRFRRWLSQLFVRARRRIKRAFRVLRNWIRSMFRQARSRPGRHPVAVGDPNDASCVAGLPEGSEPPPPTDDERSSTCGDSGSWWDSDNDASFADSGREDADWCGTKEQLVRQFENIQEFCTQTVKRIRDTPEDDVPLLWPEIEDGIYGLTVSE